MNTPQGESSDVDSSVHSLEPSPEDEEQESPVKTWISRIIWTAVFVGVVAFIWPPTWGGPVTISYVNGKSMEPTYYTGDVVIAIRSYTGDYDVGDVVVYRVDEDGLEGMVVHRLVEQLPNGNFISQGDNKEMVDPWEVKTDWIFGEVRFSIPGAAGWLRIIKSPLVIAVIVGMLITYAFWPRDDEDDEEEDELEDESDENDESVEAEADSNAKSD